MNMRRMRASVALRIVLLGFLAAVWWGLRDRVAETQQEVSRVVALEAIEIAIDEVSRAKPTD